MRNKIWKLVSLVFIFAFFCNSLLISALSAEMSFEEFLEQLSLIKQPQST